MERLTGLGLRPGARAPEAAPRRVRIGGGRAYGARTAPSGRSPAVTLT